MGGMALLVSQGCKVEVPGKSEAAGGEGKGGGGSSLVSAAVVTPEKGPQPDPHPCTSSQLEPHLHIETKTPFHTMDDPFPSSYSTQPWTQNLVVMKMRELSSL